MNALARVDDRMLDAFQVAIDCLQDWTGIDLKFWRRCAHLFEAIVWMAVVITGLRSKAGFDWVAGFLMVASLARFSWGGSSPADPETNATGFRNRNRIDWIWRLARLSLLLIMALSVIADTVVKRHGLLPWICFAAYLQSVLEALDRRPPSVSRIRVLLRSMAGRFAKVEA